MEENIKLDLKPYGDSQYDSDDYDDNPTEPKQPEPPSKPVSWVCGTTVPPSSFPPVSAGFSIPCSPWTVHAPVCILFALFDKRFALFDQLLRLHGSVRLFFPPARAKGT